MLTDKILGAIEALPDTTPAEYDEKLRRITEAFGEDLRAQFQRACDDLPDDQRPAPGIATPSLIAAFIRDRLDKMPESVLGAPASSRVEPRVTFLQDMPGRFSVKYFDKLTGRELRTWEEIDRVMGWAPLTKGGIAVRENT